MGERVRAFLAGSWDSLKTSPQRPEIGPTRRYDPPLASTFQRLLKAHDPGSARDFPTLAATSSVSVAFMAITEAHTGRRYSLSHPYHVSAAKIAEFATALGDDNPRYRGESPVAPPTFAALISAQAWNQMFADPELELALERIVHGDQRFTFFRPLRAGDVVIATAMIDKVRIRAGSELISATIEIAGRDAEPICTAQATFYHAREAAV